MFRAILKIGVRLPMMLEAIAEEIETAAEDGKITPLEGEQIAAAWSDQAGDLLRLRLGTPPVDVIGPKAQEFLARALGRIAARVYTASRG